MILVFGVLAVAIVALFAVGTYATITNEDVDTPEVAAKKAQCRKLERHIFEIMPEAKGKNLDELVANVPIEDIELCRAAYPESTACMELAPDMAALRACIPLAVECKGAKTEIKGERPVFEVSGDCGTIQITASHALVVVKAGKQIDITGNDNKIQLKLPDDAKPPQVNDQGKNNSVSVPKT